MVAYGEGKKCYNPSGDKNCHSKLMTTGLVTDARRIGRPSTSRSEENVALVREMFTRSPHKSTRLTARESGLSRHTIRTVLENILWSDEAVFHIGGFVSRHNCHYWAAHDPEVTVEKMQNRPKVTVWCGMTATRVIGPYLLHDNMNADRYLQMLED
ncbi:hypothetical protein L798_00864 [Zootermopsis nevadensis]|uniref:Transposase Tc1-like domain-containing protein n=1 Tax=Zootermopsis nevadensis TaxID=136037 RepID=A0A067QXP1_ZOONE|nr:hypothetical protein L798_00864 [Zootermopsis nevadensis]